MTRVTVLGLGLIGGSLARDLAAAGRHVSGWDMGPGIVDAARRAGVIRDARWPAALEGAELVVLAVPVGAAPALLRRIVPALDRDTVVTDVGSTKRSIVAAARELGLADRFVGSHPLAGDHRNGWMASRRGLFRGARIWVCPAGAEGSGTGSASASGGGSEGRALERVRRMWTAVGGEVVGIGAAEHDRLMAWASHLPQAVSSALGAVLERASVGPEQLGAGGRDVTRLAGSAPSIWRDILLDNADETLPALESLGEEIERLGRALRARDASAVESWLRAGRQWSALRGGETGTRPRDSPPHDR